MNCITCNQPNQYPVCDTCNAYCGKCNKLVTGFGYPQPIILCQNCDKEPHPGQSSIIRCACGERWYTRRTYGDIMSQCDTCDVEEKNQRLEAEEQQVSMSISMLFD